MLLFIKMLIDKLSQVDSRTKFHGNIQYLKRKAFKAVHEWWLRLVFAIDLCIIYTRPTWNIHLLIVFKDYSTIFIRILKHNPTVFDKRSLILAWITGSKSNIASLVLPLGVDVIKLINFGLLVLWKRHILLQFLNRMSIFEPWLIISYDIGVIQFR
jgi:hypothetical protein